MGAARDATGAAGGVAGLDGEAHCGRHRDRVLGAEDRAGD